MSTDTTTNSANNSEGQKIPGIQDRFIFDCDYLLQFCSSFDKADLEDQTDSLLEVKLEDLGNRWAKVQSTYEHLMLSSESSNTKDFKENARVNFQACSEAYYAATANIRDMLKMSKGYTTQTQVSRLSLSHVVPNPISLQAYPPNDSSVCIKVPPCDTDVFKGGYEEWPSFRDMFTAVYVNHPKLTCAQKLYHLRNKTKDSAGAIVKRYALCDENFELAWNALKSRYENKRVLVDNQLKILFNISTATAESSESIQKIQSTVNDCLATLKTLDVKIDGWDPILIYLISTKLPYETLSFWEQSLKSHRELPQWSQMDEFLTNRYEVVERISSIRPTKERYSIPAQASNKIQTYVSQEKLDSTCVLCESSHNLRICPKFRRLTTQARIDLVFKNKFFNNCLSPSHTKVNCPSKNTCLHCKKSHHSLLHINSFSKNNTGEQSSVENPSNFNQNSQHNNQRSNQPPAISEQPTTSSKIVPSKVQANFSSNNDTILLRTALVHIEHRSEIYTVRALIDPGSQRTFLSEKIRHRLHLPSFKSNLEIIGIGGQRQNATKECEIVIVASKHDIKFAINAIVLPKVAKQLPTTSFEKPNSNELNKLDLADPYFYKSAQIDLILGNDAERFINLEGIKKNICGETSAYNTIFGWVLSGPIKSEKIHSFKTNVVVSEDNSISDLLRKFWEQEEVPISTQLSNEDRYCEEFYAKTTERQPDGRYMVRLPFKNDFPDLNFLGSSRFIALAQYSALERTLAKNPELDAHYKSVLNEYLSLGHMEETSSQEIVLDGKFNSFYLPHHAVVRPEHKTTKVRVVFNASRKTKSGASLNDVLYTAPALQTDLMSTILNWRKYTYAFSGDIQKMYRQILVHPTDRAYQRILFQKHPKGPILDYQLNTLTFGVNCAPFLAIRTLLQLATDSAEKYPKIASILRRETYVDDILSGEYSIEEAITTQYQLITTLKSAGFSLKKLTANHPQLLAHLPTEDLYDADFLQFHETSSAKTLGIKWNALTDTFKYTFSQLPNYPSATKRKVLSVVAQLFDPAGWVTPVIIRAKMLMQNLWLEGTDWDEDISSDSLKSWNDLVADLQHIEEITIPRWIQYTPTDIIQIHGFSDASKGAYCACVYIRCQTAKSVVFSNLLVAKSKVAPLQPVCLPRLELNGAHLLAKLVKHISQTLDFNVSETILWTDSTIVLGWLSKPPWSWETYVANRTSLIHELVPTAKWRHVSTHDNPADLGTRGSRPQDLKNNNLWWKGPSWLTNPPSTWPKGNPLPLLKENQPIQTLHTSTEQVDILQRFSSYTKALRVVAYIFRFVHNCRKNINYGLRYESLDISHKEMQFVKYRLISVSQNYYYESEYKSLLSSKPISEKSTLKTLNPFLDSNKVLRVNGRLADSSLPFNERYPIILPGNSRFCHLYLSHLHNFLAHAEINQMCRMAQTEFYISRLKLRIKGIIHKCKVCLIYKHKPCSQIMAPLPPDRCTFATPFQTTGIDFAGPFELKSGLIRKSPIIKGYVSVFVCFVTRAIHLEPCSDLSSAAFQAAFARFVGRRGLPRRVVSDNGRNFVGASRTLLKEFTHFIKSTSSDVSQKYSTHGFEWSFIPPHAPHMGGLWEAAVKSFKHHFKKIAGAQRFTFEQFSTVLARIEGVLNSRPISAMSEDPLDLTALTPGHFLKGAPIMALPEQTSDNISLINRWEKLKSIHHSFAIRWKEDYLKSLHKRYKWKTPSSNLRSGDLVVVMDDLLPPSEWRLGRIEKTYSGSDSNIRVADIRTAMGTITRPIVKLCFLPLVDEPTQINFTSSEVASRIDPQSRRNPDLYQCELCKRFHSIRFCHKFINMTVTARTRAIERLRYCINCLAKGHTYRACNSLDTCHKCGEYHHTMLHIEHDTQSPKTSTTTQNSNGKINKRNQRKEGIQHKNQKKKGTQQKASNIPDPRILSEAIKSLATVLCVTTSNVA